MRRMKLWNILLAIMIVSALLIGCSRANNTISIPEEQSGAEDTQSETEDLSKDEDDQKDIDEEQVIEVGDQAIPGSTNQGITVNFIDFKVVEATDLPDDIVAEIENLKLSRGYAYWPQEDGSYLILISAGEKTTGGYGISVETIEDNEGTTIINMIESESSSDEMTIQILTYPYVVVKAIGITDNFVIHDQKQSEYPLLSANNMIVDSKSDEMGETVMRFAEGAIDYSQPIRGTYQGQMDNHTIEVMVGDQYMPFSADEIDRFLTGIEVGDTIEITVEISPSDQIIVSNIVKIK